MAEKKSRSRRVALTDNQAETKVGIKLIEAIEKILADGAVSERDVLAFRDWLGKAAAISDIPGIPFLQDEIRGILEDGKITEAEAWLLANSALRVLPQTERARTKIRVDEAKAKAKNDTKQRKNAMRLLEANQPTERQLAFLQQLGGTFRPGATRSQVSELIDVLVANRPTARQRMALRFWGKTELLTKDVETVSGWMDGFYSEDPNHRVAWELWKSETREDTDYSKINEIPLGLGQQYLARIKADPSLRKSPPPLPKINFLRAIFGS